MWFYTNPCNAFMCLYTDNTVPIDCTHRLKSGLALKEAPGSYFKTTLYSIYSRRWLLMECRHSSTTPSLRSDIRLDSLICARTQILATLVQDRTQS